MSVLPGIYIHKSQVKHVRLKRLAERYNIETFPNIERRKTKLHDHKFLALFVKNHIFAYLTLKLKNWPSKWPLIIKIVTQIDFKFKITSKRGTILFFAILSFLTLKSTFLWHCVKIDLEDYLETLKWYHNFSVKIPWKKLLIASFAKNYIFCYLTLKLTFWPWRSPWIIKMFSDKDCPVKIIIKRRYYTCS